MRALILLTLLLLVLSPLKATADPQSEPMLTAIEIYGYLTDQFERRVEGAEVTVYAGGQRLAVVETMDDGSYLVFCNVRDISSMSTLELRYSKFAHRQTVEEISLGDMATRTESEGQVVYFLRHDAVLETEDHITGGGWVALAIFFVTFGLILSGAVDRTIGAMVGAFLMFATGMIFGFMDQQAAVAAIDFNVIGLLMGMMIIVNVLKPTGFFQAVGIGAARLARHKPWRLLVLMGMVTALISMFIDNVTSIILMVPLTIHIAESVGIDPVPILLSEALLSNVGGVGTLIGDPPNVMIASAAGLTFNQFITHLLPMTFLALGITLVIFYFIFRSWRRTSVRMMRSRHLSMRDAIKDPSGMRKTLVVLGVTIGLFSIQTHLPVSIATIALIGATAALLVRNREVSSILEQVEWPALIFFAGLFVLVDGLSRAGVMDLAAQTLVSLSGGKLLLTTVAIIWVSAIASAFVDNIPFAATMIPLIKQIEHLGLNVMPMWWALAMGAGFGGNGTPIGASANVITVILSEKAKHPVTTKIWLKAGTPVMIITCAVATLFVVVFFGLFT